MMPARGKLLVRPVETPETLPGGKIVLTEAMRKELTAQQAEVVAVGAPSICEDERCERRHREASLQQQLHDSPAKIGDWVLLAPRCLVETDEPNLYVCAQDDVLAVLEA